MNVRRNSVKMTSRQARFIEEYLISLNATDAAKRAGYSEKTAYSIGQRLIKMKEIQEAISRSMIERSERTALTQDYVIDNLREIVTRCMNAKSFDARSAIRALELLGRHIGMFDYKLQVQKSESQDRYIFKWVGEGEALGQDA